MTIIGSLSDAAEHPNILPDVETGEPAASLGGIHYGPDVYMLLMYTSPDAEPAYGTPEFQAKLAGLTACNETAGAEGVLRGGKVEPWTAPLP